MTESYLEILKKSLPNQLDTYKCSEFFKQNQRYFNIYRKFSVFKNHADFLNALIDECSVVTSWLNLFDELNDFDSILTNVHNFTYDEDSYQKDHPNIFNRELIFHVSDLFLEKNLEQNSKTKTDIPPKTLSTLNELSRYFVFSAILSSDIGVINKSIESIFNGQTYFEFSSNLILGLEKRFKNSLDIARGDYLSSDFNERYKRILLSNVDRDLFFKLIEKNTEINPHDRIEEQIVFFLFPKEEIYSFVDGFLKLYPNLNAEYYREGLNDIVFVYLSLNIASHFVGIEIFNHE